MGVYWKILYGLVCFGGVSLHLYENGKFINVLTKMFLCVKSI